MRIKYTFQLFVGIAILVLYGCSQESNSVMSKAYHNTTAYYNAYFLADEKMNLVYDKIRDNHQDDYNRILPIFEIYDTTFNLSLKEDLEYVGKKASFPVQYHKNSKWVDDSYLLLGQVRLFQNTPDLAIQTFRYVNYKSDDEPTRHQALYWLIRTYLVRDERRQAEDVFRYLSSKEVDAKNKKDFHMTMAHYHHYLGEYEEMLTHVEQAIPEIKNDKDLKARTNFIAGQLHQYLNNDSTSYEYYKDALKGNPPYELTFFTKLNMAQVSSIEDKSELKKTKKNFSKMLVDLKNEEYRDRIYYEMAKFELKQNRIDSAFANMNRSLTQTGGNPHQKGYTYWLAGQTRFKQKKYVKAKAYYDSTFSNIKDDFPEYEEIKTRKEILTDFVEQYMIVTTQDSLHRLANMDSTELSAYLDDVVKKEEERLIKEMEAQKEAKKKKQKEENAQKLLTNNSNQNAEFIFYNAVALANAKMKFIERWGDRPLEDHWRRSNKETAFEEEKEDTIKVEKPEVEEVEEVAIKVDKQKYYRDIPFSETQKEASKEKVKHALYELGKIYDLLLEEDLDAITTFQRLQKEYPDSEYEAEVAYFLYLLCQQTGKCSTDEHKDLLLRKYANSIYAKKVINPNYAQDNEESNRASHEAYAQAFNNYSQNNYLEAHNQLNQLLIQYPNTDIKDKIVFLKVLTYAGLDQLPQYQRGLLQFKEDFKTSSLASEVDGLLATLKASKGDFTNTRKEYDVCSDSTIHYFVGVFYNKDVEKKEMMRFFDEFAQNRYPQKKFEQRHVTFSKECYIITIKSFENKQVIKEYLKKLNHYTNFKGTLKGKKYDYFQFSEDNYQVFIHNKNIDEYSKFYKSQY